MAGGGYCAFNGCDRVPKAHGMCNAHYAQWKRNGVLHPLRGPFGPAIDIPVGTRFGAWTVTGRAPNSSLNVAYWYVECDCGYRGMRASTHLRRGDTLGCESCHGQRITGKPHLEKMLRIVMPPWGSRQRAPCSVEGCPRKAHSRGLCHAHNMRRWKERDVDGPIQRQGRLPAGAREAIRIAYVSPSAPTIVELAEEYGVGRVTIWHVLRNDRIRIDDDLQERIDTRAAENVLRRTQG